MVPSGYGLVQKETTTGRALERELLERVNMKLKAAKPNDVAGLALLHEALRLNRNIWMTFAVDLASPDNACPDELKAAMISIAGYIERKTILAAADRDLLESFIEINANIIEGLATNKDAGV